MYGGHRHPHEADYIRWILSVITNVEIFSMPNLNELDNTSCPECHCDPCECAQIAHDIDDAIERDDRQERRHR